MNQHNQIIEFYTVAGTNFSNTVSLFFHTVYDQHFRIQAYTKYCLFLSLFFQKTQTGNLTATLRPATVQTMGMWEISCMELAKKSEHFINKCTWLIKWLLFVCSKIHMYHLNKCLGVHFSARLSMLILLCQLFLTAYYMFIKT